MFLTVVSNGYLPTAAVNQAVSLPPICNEFTPCVADIGFASHCAATYGTRESPITIFLLAFFGCVLVVVFVFSTLGLSYGVSVPPVPKPKYCSAIEGVPADLPFEPGAVYSK